MSREISILKKEEAYSYDELDLLEEKLLPLVTDKTQQAEVGTILKALKASIVERKKSMAVFFMPQASFNIFSMLQGDNSICTIQKENIESLYKACDLFDATDDFAAQPIYAHLKNKLGLLNEYLLQGNTVFPTTITADNFVPYHFS